VAPKRHVFVRTESPWSAGSRFFQTKEFECAHAILERYVMTRKDKWTAM
jgi:hypothetical protein